MKGWILLLLCLLNIVFVYSSDSYWDSERIVIENKSDNTVCKICCGEEGFVWLSTDRSYLQLCQGGMSCFDKEKFLPFEFNKPFNMKDNHSYCWKATVGELIQIPISVQNKWYHTQWAHCDYGLFLAIFVCWLYYYYRKRTWAIQVHREHGMQLKKILNIEKVELEQKQEIKAMKDRLSMLVVQELHTPLSLIINPLKDVMKEQRFVSDFEVRGQVAYRNALCVLNNCNQLLAICNHDHLNALLKVAPYPVERLIDSSLCDIRELIKAFSIHLQYKKCIKKNMLFYVDKKKIEFIIHNLLTNAFSHVNYAGNVSLTVCETLQKNQHCVTIIVEDEGQMEVKVAEQLMEGNNLLAEELTAREIGSSLVRKFVLMHHGIITLESFKEKGTKVWVHIPLDKSIFQDDPQIVLVEPEELPDMESESSDIVQLDTTIEEAAVSFPPAANNARRTLLVVEDNEDIRFYLKVLFNREYNILIATNGQEGIDMARKELPDLIICDVMMPVKDGFECCREVKEGLDTCSIPVIMLTAKVEENHIIRGLDIGADDYILKPFAPTILQAKVRNLINSRQALKQKYAKLLISSRADAVGVSESGKVEDPFISSVIKVVEENLCKEDFSVKKLATEMNMSQPTLYRKVKQSTDYTIIELIRGVRMHRAAVLLKTKEFEVQEVAEMVGYNDVPTFRKHFVYTFGTTPSTYE